MLPKRITTALLLLLAFGARAQQLSLGNTPSVLTKSAVLELNSAKQGLLLPRLTDTVAINTLNPPDGMVIYFLPSRQLLVRSNGYWSALTATTSLSNYWGVEGNSNGSVKKFGTLDNNDLPFVTNNAERMRLTTAGRLGIGISNPSTLLHVAGTNPLTLQGVQVGGTTTTDSLLTINSGTVQKLPVATFQQKLNGTGFIKASGGSISYDNNTYTVANAAITGATKTKITYDSKGLVTAGADATTSDIAEGSNLYFTEGRTRTTALTGLSTSTATAVTATDNVLSGVGKLQAQINAVNSASYLTGNQNISFTASGDASGTASGTTSLAPSLTITGLRGAALPALSTGLLKYNGSAWAFDNSTYLTSETSTLAAVTARGNSTATGINLTQNGNLTTSYGLLLKRATDASPQGNLLLAQNAAATTDLFKVDVAGNTTANAFIKSGGTASQFLKADGSVDNNSYLTGNQSITLSGDITGSGTSAIATAIGANKVTLGHMAQVGTGTFLGRATTGTGNVEALTTTQVKTVLGLTGNNSGDVSLNGQNYLTLSGQTITANAIDLSGAHATGTLAAARFGALTGDVTNTAGSYATTIANGAVTYGKMQNVSATSRLLGRYSTGAGSPEEVVIGAGLLLTGNTLSATAATNWNMNGNAGVTATQFLGTTDDKALVLKSNNSSFFELGRRQTLGLTQSYTDYSDDNEQVMHLRSSLQFYAPAANFYKPKMYVDANGNFRVKGSSAGTDYFEFGATGSNNNGGFEFIIGDDGDEPILFKSNHYLNGTTEIMRLQSGRMSVGSNAFNATNPEKLLIDAGVTNSYNLMTGKGSIDNYLQINVQNRSATANASSDLVATADNGDENTNFIDMGINSSAFTNTSYPVISGINNTYLYGAGNDFVIGNATAGKPLRFFTGGYSLTNERMRIDGDGNVGIGTTSPAVGTKLDVVGSVKIGAAGNAVKNMVTAVTTFSSTQTVGAAALNTLNATLTPGSLDITYTLPAANTLSSSQATVQASPSFDLPTGVSIASARMISATQVKVRFLNSSTTARTLSSGSSLYLTITEF